MITMHTCESQDASMYERSRMWQTMRSASIPKTAKVLNTHMPLSFSVHVTFDS